MSGRRRSTPRCSSRGNARPASTTRISPPSSYTVMFLPTSPRPPSGTMRRLSLIRLSLRLLGWRAALCDDALEQAEPLEAVAHRAALLVRRLDERQSEAADVMAEKVERRLDRDRVRRDAEQLDGRVELLVEAPGALDITGAEAAHHRLDLRPHDVGVHTHATEPSELEEREDQVVVSGVEGEAELDDRPRLLEVGVRLLHRTHVRDLRELRDGVGLQ